jgi:hypothetical protein
MNRHEIPTHLEVEDKILGTLTVRQMLFLTVGVSVGYALWGALAHVPAVGHASWHVPLMLRAAIALLPVVASLLLALAHPGGRPLEEWLLTRLRYATLPKVSVWRASVEPEEQAEEVQAASLVAGTRDGDEDEESGRLSGAGGIPS